MQQARCARESTTCSKHVYIKLAHVLQLFVRLLYTIPTVLNRTFFMLPYACLICTEMNVNNVYAVSFQTEV